MKNLKTRVDNVAKRILPIGVSFLRFDIAWILLKALHWNAHIEIGPLNHDPAEA